MGDKPESISEDQFHKKRIKPNILSKFFLWWVCPVILTGNKRDVEEEDLVVPGKVYGSKRQGDQLERYVNPLLIYLYKLNPKRRYY